MLRALILATVSLAAAAVLAIPVLAAPSAQTVRVNEVSYRISLSAKPAGLVKFAVRNASDDVRLLGQGRRQDLEDARHRRGRHRRADRSAQEGRQVRVLVRGVSDHASEGMRGSFVAR